MITVKNYLKLLPNNYMEKKLIKKRGTRNYSKNF